MMGAILPNGLLTGINPLYAGLVPEASLWKYAERRVALFEARLTKILSLTLR
jgi:hypothetical protein